MSYTISVPITYLVICEIVIPVYVPIVGDICKYSLERVYIYYKVRKFLSNCQNFMLAEYIKIETTPMG